MREDTDLLTVKCNSSEGKGLPNGSIATLREKVSPSCCSFEGKDILVIGNQEIAKKKKIE